MERDELARLIEDCISEYGAPCSEIAAEVIASGWRKVPDDCVVVRREDAQVIADGMWCESSGHDCGLSDPERDEPVRQRIAQALADQPT